MIKTGDPVWLKFNGNTGEIRRYNGKVYAYESLKNAQKALGPGERNAVLMEYAPKQRWIPVEERLPETVPCSSGTAYSEAVNVLTDGRKVLTAIWNGERFLCDADYWEAWGEKITHWTPVLLPLPEHPGKDGA